MSFFLRSLLAVVLAASFALRPSLANPVSLEEAQAQLARVEASDTPDQAMVQALWQETIDAIKRAAESQRKAEDSRATLQSAPAELATINKQLSQPPPASPAPDASADRASLQRDLTEIEQRPRNSAPRLPNSPTRKTARSPAREKSPP